MHLTGNMESAGLSDGALLETTGQKAQGTELLWSQPASLVSSHLSLAVVKAASGYTTRNTVSDGGRRCFSHRVCLAMLGSLLFVQMYIHRISMGIAIVRMVNHTALGLDPHNDDVIRSDSPNLTFAALADNITVFVSRHPVMSNDSELASNSSLSTPAPGLYAAAPCVILSDGQVTTRSSEDGPFVWDKAVQGHLLGAFYYGYTVSQLPGALAARRLGGTLLVAICIVLVAMGSCAVPLVADWGYGYVIPLRALLGVGEGALFPALVAVLGRWSPPHERTKMLGIVFAGGGLGLIVAHPIAGLLSHFCRDGWSLIFYALGVSTLLTLVPWLIFASDEPSGNRFISASEKQYIEDCLRGQLPLKRGKGTRTPWCSLAMSMPVYAIAVGMMTTDWGYTVYLSYIPTYLHEVLHMDLDKNALFSALPFVGHTIVLTLFPLLIDTLISRKLVRLAAARKLAHCVGAVGAAVMLLCLATVDCRNPLVAVALLTMGVSLGACVYSGFSVNVLDLSPIHGATILALGNTISSAAGFLSPLGVTALTKDESHEGWQHVFYLSAGIYLAGTVFYCAFSSSTLQPWGLDLDLDDSCEEDGDDRQQRAGSKGSSKTHISSDGGDLEISKQEEAAIDLYCPAYGKPAGVHDCYSHGREDMRQTNEGDLKKQEIATALQHLLDSGAASRNTCSTESHREDHVC